MKNLNIAQMKLILQVDLNNFINDYKLKFSEKQEEIVKRKVNIEETLKQVDEYLKEIETHYHRHISVINC
jgi:hypothetical protein